MITRIIFVRHGETIANRNNIFRGQVDFPLNDIGIMQAQALADELVAHSNINAIYTSPLTRAVQTALPTAKHFNLQPIVCENFTNISLGSWEGVLHSEVSQNFHDLYTLWRTNPEKLEIPNGESLEKVGMRAFNATMEIAHVHVGQTVMIVSHRAVLKPLFAKLLNMAEPYFWKIQIDPASYSLFEFDSERFTLMFSNFTRHLPDVSLVEM